MGLLSTETSPFISLYASAVPEYVVCVPPAVCRTVEVVLNTQPRPRVLGEKMIKSHLR